MSSERRVSVYHDKNRHRVFLTIHDETVSISIWLSPYEATEIGLIGQMAEQYQEVVAPNEQ